MIVSHHVLQQKPLPPYLLAAAIDYINSTRPGPDSVPANLAAFALRLGYDATIAAVLATRVTATARMFADPLWPSVRGFTRRIHPADAPLFDRVVRRFIETEPLNVDFVFDPRRLLAELLSALPHQGQG
jgi:hypothetical protein